MIEKYGFVNDRLKKQLQTKNTFKANFSTNRT